MSYYYDYFLVFLSLVLAIIASFAALNLAVRIARISGIKAIGWLLGGSISMGMGIWSMHFVGMLAFHLPIEIVYDPWITFYSVVVAIIASGLALSLVKKMKPGGKLIYLSATIFGLGIAGMHYTGMAAIMVTPPIQYNPSKVAISVLIAIITSYFALHFIVNVKNPDSLLNKNSLISAILMGAAIAGMHYSAMSAAYFDADSICSNSSDYINRDLLAAIVVVLSLMILFLTILPLSFEIRLAEKNTLLLEQLQEHNDSLVRKAEEMALTMTQAMQKSAERDNMLAALIEQINDAIIVVDLEDKITLWNSAASQIYGYGSDEVQNRSIDFLSYSGGGKAAEKPLRVPGLPDIITHQHRDGHPIYVDINQVDHLDSEQNVIGKIFLSRDVSKYYEEQQQLILWGTVYRNSYDGIIVTDTNNRVISVNSAFTRITGYEERDILGRHPNILSSGQHDQKFYEEMWKELKEKDRWTGEIWNRKKNGEIFPERLSISVIKDEAGKVLNYIASFADITVDKQSQARIKHLAYYDQLTGLPNRILMLDRLKQAMVHVVRINKKIGVLFLDLDNFKNINDKMGHSFGDRLLQEVAVRLENIVRDDDTVCRLGGDEFIIIIQEIVNMDDLALISEKIIRTIEEEFIIVNEIIRISTSIGIAVYPNDGESPDEVIKNADMAMYVAKSKGRNQYQFFTSEINKNVHERMQIENELDVAIRNDALDMAFQPQVDMRTGKIIGAEALLRWERREHGLLSPENFIFIAEETGLIVEVDRWVINRVSRLVANWVEQYPEMRNLKFAINISGLELNNEDFLQVVYDALSENSCPGSLLEFEITETKIMKNIEDSVAVIEKLRESDISVAIDDFGTGYSSLNYLKRLPVSKLKIDRTFIQDLGKSDSDQTITGAVIVMAQTLGMNVIAEGVETKEQADFLLSKNCNFAQGFYYHYPLTPEQFLKRVLEQYS